MRYKPGDVVITTQPIASWAVGDLLVPTGTRGIVRISYADYGIARLWAYRIECPGYPGDGYGHVAQPDSFYHARHGAIRPFSPLEQLAAEAE